MLLDKNGVKFKREAICLAKLTFQASSMYFFLLDFYCRFQAYLYRFENLVENTHKVRLNWLTGLAKKLRNSEEKLDELTVSRVKIVEKAGRKIQDILTQSDPWKGTDCIRENCLLCNSKRYRICRTI